MEKLDPQSKILLATGAINYLANQLHSLNKQMKMAVHLRPECKDIFEDGIKNRDEILENSIVRLKIVMEELSDCLNDCDAVQAIDVKVVTPAFDVLVHGKDSLE